jgi:hypothetical protein
LNRRRLLIGSAIGCGVLLVVGVLVLAAAVIGANIGMQKAKEQANSEGDEDVTINTPSREPKKNEPEYIPVTLRVSGEQGTRYRCTYGTFTPEGKWDEVQEGTLATSPVEYRAQAVIDHPEEHGTIIAGCSRVGANSKGRLKLELLANGVVVDSDEAERGLPDTKYKKHADPGHVRVNYDPRCGGPTPKSGPCK